MDSIELDNLYPCNVVDNNDPDKAGKVQVEILTVGTGFNPDHLHWVKPKTAFLGGSTDSGESRIPEIDSKIYVTFEKPDTLRNGFYIWDIDLADFNIHSFFDDNVASSITEMNSSYPDIKFRLYKNGIVHFTSSDSTNPETGTYHPSGTYTLIDKDGNIIIKTGSKKARVENSSGYFELKDTGQFDVNGNLTVDP